MARRPILILLGLFLVLSLTACNLPASLPAEDATPAPTEAEIPPDPQVDALRTLEQNAASELDIQFDEGFPVFVEGRIPVAGENAGERALAFIAQYETLYLQNDPDLHLGVRSVGGVDGEDVTLYQMYKGVPIFASEMVISLDGSEVYATYGQLLTDVFVDVTPEVTLPQAEEAARSSMEAPDAQIVGQSGLMVFDMSLLEDVPSNPRLAWRVTLGQPANAQVFIDAHTGELLFQYGLSLDALVLNFRDANYTDNTFCYFLSPDDELIGDASSFDSAYASDIDAVNGYQYAIDVYNFFMDTFRRDSYNGTGGDVEVYVHTNADNARYIGYGCHMIEFRDGWVGWDVMVHEFTHGVIGNTSGLVYANQSGALNEGYADTMASVADPDDWTLAEDRTSGMGPIRDMSNPPAFGDPDRFSSFVMTSNDNGGVHTNSGILNKAAFLVSDGGDFNGYAINGIGRAQMGQLFYAVMVSLPSNANFMTARNATVARAFAASWLTDEEACDVQNAFAAVELGDGDIDCDGVDDSLDPDNDRDYIPDSADNCPFIANPSQADFDRDGVGDPCDNDADGDGLANSDDNCPLIPNPTQPDSDGNGIGDHCQDIDGDTVRDFEDNCRDVYNPRQEDMDSDRQGDACDEDIDNDALPNAEDLCPYSASFSNSDYDGDGVGDNCDVCWRVADPGQEDRDGDGIGDVCDNDQDGDGLPNDRDNCPYVYNPDQWDQDGNGTGQACDDDENLSRWGVELPFDIFGNPFQIGRVPLPVCLADCPDYFDPGYQIDISLGGFSENIRFWVSDQFGRTVGAPSLMGDGIQGMSFAPFGGHSYFLNLAFGPEFPEGGQESGSMSMGESYGAGASEPSAEPSETATPTATAEPTMTTPPDADVQFWVEDETIAAGACTTMYWEVSNVKKVVFGGNEVAFEGSYTTCQCQAATYPLTVTFLDDSVQKYYVNIQVTGTCATATTAPTSTPVATNTPTETPQPQPPAQPTSLQANTSVCSAFDYEVTLTWKDNANNESGYRVYRDGNLIATLGANVTSYKDHPSYSGPHTYYVQAYNDGGAVNSSQTSDSGCIY